MDNPLVSIIIPTYNSEKTLDKCLEHVKGQIYRNIEIIIVDRFSEDGTIELARKYSTRVFFLDAERAGAKNFGFSKSRGKCIFFIDSDMELTERVVEECVKFTESNPKIGGIIIPERSIGNNFWAKVRDFERSFYAGTEVESARFFRRELLDEIGGFDEDVVLFEESTLPQKIEKLGYNVKAKINAEILHHENNFSLLNWLKKKYYYGKTAQKYKQRYKEYGEKQMGLFYRFGLFLKSKRFYSKLLLAVGVLTLKFLEYFSAGLGFLASKAKK